MTRKHVFIVFNFKLKQFICRLYLQFVCLELVFQTGFKLDINLFKVGLANSYNQLIVLGVAANLYILFT